jgi:hypothetical protein
MDEVLGWLDKYLGAPSPGGGRSGETNVARGGR